MQEELIDNITTQRLSSNQYSPLVIQSNETTDSFQNFLTEHKSQLEKMTSETGAILFRGSKLAALDKMQMVANVMIKNITKDNTDHTPLTTDGAIQRPVKYAQDEFLLWHNENTFNKQFPSKAIFACEQPATEGGQTPIVDSRLVFSGLDVKIRDEFINKKVMYVRSYEEGDYLGLGWKTIFRTENKAIVEAKCKAMHLDFEWKNSNILLTRAIRPAIFQHPKSNETCWINQAQHWHFSCLSPETREGLATIFEKESDYPRNCYFGDGSFIPDEYMDEILKVYQANQLQFDWQQGDILLVDNILKSHARNPYKGERKLLVCFGDYEVF